MPRQTLTEKVDELMRSVAVLGEQIRFLEEQTNGTEERLVGTTDKLNEMQRVVDRLGHSGEILQTRLREQTEMNQKVTAELARNAGMTEETKTRLVLLEHQMAQIVEQFRGFGEIKTLSALLQRDLDEMKKHREEVGKKWWSLLPPIIGALAAGVVGALVTLFVTKR